MTAMAFASLVIAETKAKIYAKGLQIATALGIPTTTWEAGDPTRSDYHFIAELLELTEAKVVTFIRAGFLDWMTEVGDYEWLKVHALQRFNVTAVEATYATCTVRLTNAQGGVYTYDPGDITVRNGDTGKTYRNTTGGTLLSGVPTPTTLDLDFVADEAGSESSSAVGEIDETVTVDVGVTCSNLTAAVGLDAESADSVKQRCRDKLGALSPNGPRDAYAYVARDPDLTGTSGITRVRVYDDSTTGDVLIYLAGPSGAVSAEDLALVTDAILLYATPLCITPTVSNATNLVIQVTYKLWVYASDSRTDEELEEQIEEALEQLFAAKPIGGDIIPPSLTGAVYRSHVDATIKAVSTYAFRVSVSLPNAELTAVANNEVAVLGTIIGTIARVADP